MLKRFIEKLIIDMGYEQALDANEDGSYSLPLEPDIDVNLKEEANQVIRLYTQLAELPASNTESFLLKIMIANLFGRETGGAAFGLDTEGKKLILVDFLTEEEKYRNFYDRLENFVNYADAWRQETRHFNETQSAEG